MEEVKKKKLGGKSRKSTCARPNNNRDVKKKHCLEETLEIIVREIFNKVMPVGAAPED